MLNPLLKRIDFCEKEDHRQATWLELFFDLAFVISIAALTAMLVESPNLGGLILYAFLFLAVYWAWNQFTWYASHFDNDDVFFRIMYLSAILAILILAASVKMIAHGNTTLFVASYILLQIILAAGWTRVFFSKAEYRSFSLKFLLGQIVGSIIWIASLGFPISQQYYIWAIALLVHISAPYFAWKTKTFHIPVHTNHILERYCLFTIIVMGETLAAVMFGMRSADSLESFLPAIFGYVTIACIWWTYFNWDFKKRRELKSFSNVFVFGYGHFVVFLSIAAFGVGIEVVTHSATHGGHLTILDRILVALTPSLYLISLSVLNRYSWGMPFERKMKARVGIATLCIALALFTEHATPIILTGGTALLMIFLVIYELNIKHPT